MNNTADDGQHQQSARYHEAMLNIDVEGMRMLGRHLLSGTCSKPYNPDADIPVTFTVDEKDQTVGTIICGVCGKEVGKCKLTIEGGL